MTGDFDGYAFTKYLHKYTVFVFKYHRFVQIDSVTVFLLLMDSKEGVSITYEQGAKALRFWRDTNCGSWIQTSYQPTAGFGCR
jgi:hypothetical protein